MFLRTFWKTLWTKTSLGMVFGFLKIDFGPPPSLKKKYYGTSASIRIGQDVLCLPYTGFFFFMLVACVTFKYRIKCFGNFSHTTIYFFSYFLLLCGVTILCVGTLCTYAKLLILSF